MIIKTALLLLIALIGAAPAQQDEQPPPVDSAQRSDSPMARLDAVFAAARPAERAELNGNWVLVTQVYTQQSINGQDGPDHILSNEEGIRNGDAYRQSKPPDPDNPQQLYWKLTFKQVGDRVQVISQSGWASWDVEPITFGANGDFEFEPDFGAEGDFKHLCRMESATRMVCLFHKGGDGLEFRKIAH